MKMPGDPEEDVSVAAQLQPLLAEFALLSVNPCRAGLLLDHATEIFVVSNCGKKR